MAHPPHGFTVGLIVGSTAIWRWQYQLIQSLSEWGVIDVREIIVLGLPDFKLDKSISMLHYLDGKIFSSPVNAFELVDTSEIQSDVNSYNEFVSAEKKNVDVLINLSEVVAPKDLILIARLGVLSPVFSEERDFNSQYLGIDQYLNKHKQVYLSVLAQNAAGQEKLLATAKPSFDSGSLSRNLSQYWIWFAYLWKQSIDALAENTDIAVLGSDALSQSETRLNQLTNKSLSISQTVTSLFRSSGHVKQKLQQKYLNTEQWVLLLKHLNKDSASVDGALKFSEYLELSPPTDCFWADPFAFSKDGHDCIFFEELPFATERGHLSCMEVFADGSHSDPKIIIQETHHLSYPNVFEYEAEQYLIPESGDNGTVDLYRCTEFPYCWEHHKTLIKNIHAYDSTLIEYHGRWWLFATVVPELGLSGCEALYIFHADSPISTDWLSHAKNPVISDASSARPGGNFYVENDQLYRVSQDCAGQYGAGVNINKVIEISAEQYKEIKVSSHYPEWDENLVALHTFNFNKNIAVADALRVKTKGLFQ